MVLLKQQDIGLITHIQRFAINDGPGIRTTVFFKGCPLNCKWCHNPECISDQIEIFFNIKKCRHCGLCVQACPEGIIDLNNAPRMRIDRRNCSCCMKCVEACPYGALKQIGEVSTAEMILVEVERDTPFYRNSCGGLTLSGGEPLSQLEFATNLILKAKERGIHTAVDTCGYWPFDRLEKILASVDLVLFDLKHTDSECHRKGTGVANEMILKNCIKLAGMQLPLRIRVPLIPSYNDTNHNIQALAGFMVSQGLGNVDLLPYHMYASAKYEGLGKGYEFDSVKPLSDERVKEIEQLFIAKGIKVTIGG